MKYQSNVNYVFGRKNNWRQRVWNEIASRVPDKRSATCLYLAAESDLDRKVALRKGFKNKNLFAVDRNKLVIDSLRAQKRPAIHGDVREVVKSFGGADVVFADFCCGLNDHTLNLFTDCILGGGLKRSGVLCINMLRGRDPGDILNLGKSVATMFPYRKEGMEKEAESEKHRGVMLFTFAAVALSKTFYGNEKNFDLVKTMGFIDILLNPIFLSYKCEDGIRRMDSVVITNNFLNGYKNLLEPNESLKRKISAQKAIATMRYGS